MTLKQAMAASGKDLGVMMFEEGHNPSCAHNLNQAWPLIPRDHKDKNYQAFWSTATAILYAMDRAYAHEVLVDVADPARVARIICVAWLWLKTKGQSDE